jgi:predicted transposase YdaD
VVASEKLFYWLFQSQPDRILQLLPDLPTDAGGYRFVAPVWKALEHRPDGAFLAAEESSALPALLLEAQMQADPIFFLRFYGESGRFLLQEKIIRRWQVVVICPHRAMAFGDPEPAGRALNVVLRS